MQERVLWTGSPWLWRAHPMGILVVLTILVAAWMFLIEAGRATTWLLLLLIAVSLFAIVSWTLTCLATRLTIRERRISLQTGFWVRQTLSVRPEDVRTITVSQSLMQQLLGVGRITITGSGEGDQPVTINGIRDPQNVAELIHELRESARRR